MQKPRAEPSAHGVKPFQGWTLRDPGPRVASQARQPWAGLWNAFGVRVAFAARVHKIGREEKISEIIQGRLARGIFNPRNARWA